jgi:hypothetical protein
MRPRTAADALEYPIAWLRDLELSLDIRCACHASSTLSFRLMLDEQPGLVRMPLGRVLIRMRCQRTCRGKPTRVALLHHVEHATWAGQKSRPRPWELVLIGADEPD